MDDHEKFVPTFASTAEVEKRRRAIQLVVNVIEPDPNFQPMFFSDETRLSSCTRNEEDVIISRMRAYFGQRIEFDINSTLIDLVDTIARQIPNWLQDEKL